MIAMPAIDPSLARYELLASAISGRPIALAPAPDGEPSFTDGRTIFVSNPTDEIACMAELTVQGALLRAGSLDPGIVRRLLGRSSVARRYLALEGYRALAELEPVLPALVRRVSAPLAPLDAEPSSGTATSLRRAIAREPLPDPPPGFGAVRPRRLLRALDDDEGGAPTPQDLEHGAPSRSLPEIQEEDETQDLGAIAKLFSTPLGASGPVARLLANLLGLGREAASGPAGAELPTGAARAAARPGSRAARSSLPAGLEARDPDPGEIGVAVYPEWDVRSGRYRPGWCTVAAITPPVRPGPPTAVVRDERLRRSLARLGVGLEPTRRQPQGDDLDLDALVEIEIDRRVGGAGVTAESAYVDQLRRRRDLGVLVLLDISGSSRERGPSGESVHEYQRRAASLLVDALASLGDRVAVYGFHSRGRGAVRVLRVKAFDDPYDARARGRLDDLEPGSFTRLGAGIRHASHLLQTEAGTPRRLLVFLSDGFAYDYGYEGSYGEADARRALLEAREDGIGCLCLSVGVGAEPEALRSVFGTASYTSVERIEDLRDSIGVLFRRALLSAERRRLVTGRTARRP